MGIIVIVSVWWQSWAAFWPLTTSSFLQTGTAGGMELDAFVVQNARVSVLKDMGTLLYLSTSPPAGMADLDFDVLLCSGWGVNVVCKVPGPKKDKSVKNFVHKLCYLVSIRCKAVAPPPDSWLDGKRKTYVCRQSRELALFEALFVHSCCFILSSCVCLCLC
jgi:hypothetical protein